MKFYLFLIFSHGQSAGCASNLLEFDSLDQAEQTKRSLVGNKNHLYDALHIFSKKRYSKEELFVELLKSNPVAEPKEIWDRAQVAYSLMYRD